TNSTTNSRLERGASVSWCRRRCRRRLAQWLSAREGSQVRFNHVKMLLLKLFSLCTLTSATSRVASHSISCVCLCARRFVNFHIARCSRVLRTGSRDARASVQLHPVRNSFICVSGSARLFLALGL